MNQEWLCAAAEMALMMCEKFENTGPGTSETEIIEMIIGKELTGEYTTKFTKADLKRSVDNIVDRNFERARKKMSIIDYLKYISKLKTDSKKHKDELFNEKYLGYVYEK